MRAVPRPSEDADAADNGIHVVAVAFGVGDPLEREHHDALAEHRPVGRGREG
jgi:hypothetical protein